jgi:hypothetical protein
LGGRYSPRGGLLAAALLLLGALGAAQAQDAGLKSGAASLAAGKYDNAVRQLSATVNSDNASAGEAAKALYLRGIAYRKLGQPGRALADLGAALWLGLPASDRMRAQVNRGLAYGAAGLTSQANAEFAQARKSGGSGEVDRLIAEDGGTGAGTASVAFATEADSDPSAPAPPPTRTAAAPQGSWDTTVSSGAAQPQSGGNRLTRWWGSVTESSEPAPAPPPPTQTAAATPRAAPAPAAQAPAAAPPSTGWGATTETAAAATEQKSSSWRLFGRGSETQTAAAPPRAASSGAGGAYRLQFAASRSEAEANALWKKVSRESAQLAGKRPRVNKTEIGSFGTFYSLTVGPFSDKAETLKVCNALKRSGNDCFLEGAETQ